VGIGLRRTLNPPPPIETSTPDNVYVPHPAVSDLLKAVSYREGGVYVFWANFQTGKSGSLLEVVKKLEAQQDRAVIAINAASFKNDDVIDTWFLEMVTSIPGCKRGEVDLNKFGGRGGQLSKPYPSLTIIIDHFDIVMNKADHSIIEDFLTYYAQSSNAGKKFNILLCVSNAKHAHKIVSWNGRTKILLAMHPECAKWGADGLAKLFEELERTNVAWQPGTSERWLQLSELSGSPSVAKAIYHAGEDRVSLHAGTCGESNDDWIAGIQLLSSRFRDIF
jgi:hypothetical protein